jgi:hypothetical protein
MKELGLWSGSEEESLETEQDKGFLQPEEQPEISGNTLEETKTRHEDRISFSEEQDLAQFDCWSGLQNRLTPLEQISKADKKVPKAKPPIDAYQTDTNAIWASANINGRNVTWP